MNPDLDRLGNAIDERAQELRVWGESLHTVNDLMDLTTQARELAHVFDEIADDAADRIDQISEGE